MLFAIDAARLRLLLHPQGRPNLKTSSPQSESQPGRLKARMTVFFSFSSFLCAVLLVICTATYLKPSFPGMIDNKKPG